MVDVRVEVLTRLQHIVQVHASPPSPSPSPSPHPLQPSVRPSLMMNNAVRSPDEQPQAPAPPRTPYSRRASVCTPLMMHSKSVRPSLMSG